MGDSVQRKLQDAVANPSRSRSFPIDTADEIKPGYIMWWDRANSVARAANHANAWTGTEAGAQGKIAEHFLGVAESGHVANDTKITAVQIHGDGVFHFPLATAAAVEIGDIIAATRDGVTTTMLPDTVVKLTGGVGAIQGGEPSRGIGRVWKRSATSVAEVDVEMRSSRLIGGGIRGLLTS